VAARGLRTRVTAACWIAAVVAGSAAATMAAVRPSDRASPTRVASDSTLYASDPALPMFPPVAAVQARSLHGGASINVPILLYHYIRTVTNPKDKVGYELSTPPAVFKQEMDWLHEAGGHTVTLKQVMAALQGRATLPSHPVVLTFDDGHDDFATRAVPVLKADGFVATVFVNTGFMGHPSYMSAAQVQQVAAAGMTVGDHTVNHVDLSALPAAAARSEILADRTELEQLLGVPILDFAYPYGDFDASVVSIVAAAGFRDAVTVELGRTELLSQPFTMPRIRVGGGDTVWSFAAKAGVPAPPRDWVDPF
jgi:peptidoglycan/xylan/chitin deacetylase (PgdA/CDA1 family)